MAASDMIFDVMWMQLSTLPDFCRSQLIDCIGILGPLQTRGVARLDLRSLRFSGFRASMFRFSSLGWADG